MGHALMENRHGLIVDGCVTQANGHAERTAALAMIEKHADRPNRITLGADKGYDAEDFVNELRSMNVTPHIARNIAGQRSALDGRTTRHPGYAVSQRIRNRIEKGFGRGKEVGLLRRTASSGCGAASASTWPSPSRPRPATSSACQSCWLNLRWREVAVEGVHSPAGTGLGHVSGRGARTAKSPTLTLFAVHKPKSARNEADRPNVDPSSAVC